MGAKTKTVEGLRKEGGISKIFLGLINENTTKSFIILAISEQFFYRSNFFLVSSLFQILPHLSLVLKQFLNKLKNKQLLIKTFCQIKNLKYL